MSKAFVLDTNKQPVDSVHPGWARKLLASGQAAVYRRYPFTLILKRRREQPVTLPLRVKQDPGSKTNGIAVVNDASGEVLFADELAHRGRQIKAALDARRGVRRSRRQRTNNGTIQGISHRHCAILQRADGDEYTHAEKGVGISSCPLNGAGLHAR